MSRIAGVVALLAALPAWAAAQQQDTTDVHRLRAVVVTAERVRAPVKSAVHAVSRITRAELRMRPVRTLAEAVQQAPGIAFVDFEGTFADPQAIVRGFYGGGEADYLQLLVDGRPINGLENGRINWDLLPLSSIESVEVMRGAGSAAWGDAALGGVINVITRQPGAGVWRGALRGGTHGSTRASASGSGALGRTSYSGFADFGRTGGFRAHAQRSTGTIGLTLGSPRTERGLSFSTLHDWRAYDEPGALTDDELAASRAQSSAFHRFDGSDERLHRARFDAHTLAGSARLRGSLTGELRRLDRIRTVRLAPEFADTKNRVLNTARLSGGAELETSGLLSAADDMLLGIDVSYGRIASDYYDYAQGPEDAYQAPAARGQLNGSVTGNRAAVAAFARYGLQASSALKFTLAGRLDWLRDEFDAEDLGVPAEPRSYLVASPRVGVNLRYLENERHSGHVYANVSQSFKAPTPDQLYDRRMIPIPFEPYQITFSNPDLDPQHGTSYEVGIYQEADLAPGALSADLSFAAYQIDLRAEIDFDINTFGYRNLGRSRHRGVEAGLNLRGPRGTSVFANYTVQAATAQAGENSGNYLKAIPRHFMVSGITVGSARSLSATLSVTTARKAYLDDSNLLLLPDWTRLDARLAYRWRTVVLSVDGFNLLDRAYSTTGFPDAGSAAVYYYPAARRTLQLGLSWGS